MCQSDQQFNSPQEPDAKHYSQGHDLDPLKYGYSDSDKIDELSQKFSLIAYNDQVRHFRDAVQRIHLASKKVPEFAEMVAKRIQDHGRATVVRSREPDLLFERQRLLSATGLSSCIRNARDEFREEVCFEIIQWLESLSSCDLLKANEPLRNLFCGAFCKKWERGVRLTSLPDEYERGSAQLDSNLNIPSMKEADTMHSLPWEHIEPLCHECGYSVFDTRGDGHIGSRLQYLAYLDIRFWKAFRLALHTMYATTLITNLKWKGMICYQYCDIYPFIAEMFLNLDGDPENNVMCTLSCQLFLFFDIGYIVSRGQNSDVSLTDSMVPMTCDILALFQGKPTMKREIDSHVEYESSDYTAYFHAIPIIYQLAEYVTQCLKIGEAQNRKEEIFQSAIRHVVKVILQLENSHSLRADHNEVDYGIFSKSLRGKQGDANNPVVSFLHPLHSFLSWLIEYASFKDSDELIRLIHDASINATNNDSVEAFENRLFMRSLTVDEITRVKIEDEIIHQLCLGSMNYTKLCSQIPEHIVSERFFDSTLEKVASFRKPTSGKESGTFVLKDEYYKRVNPYYHNYSSNKRDEVLKLMKERVTRSSQQPLIDVVIEPAHASPGRAGIYHSLGRFTSSQHFVKFLVTCLRYVLLEGSRKLDALLDTLLHLVHTCASEQWNESRADKSFCQRAVGTEIGSSLSLASTLYTLLLQDDVKEHHAKVRAIFRCLHTSLLHAPCNNMVENDSERKKRLATRRQEKLMAKFKKQQASFLQQNDLANDCSDTEMEDANEDGWKFPTSHCILCQDTAKDAGPFGLIVHVSRSSEFREIPFEDDYWLMKAFSGNANLDRDEKHTYPEAMTQAFKDFMKNVEEGSVIGPGFKNDGNVSSKLVSSTCDFLLPPPSNLNAFDDLSRNKLHDKNWFHTFCKAASNDLQEYAILTNVARDIIGQDSDSLTSTGQQQFRILLSNMFQILSLLTFPQIFKADSSNILVNTIKATEISLRGICDTSGLVYHQISNNALINLRALNEFRITSLMMKTSNWVKNSHQKPDTHVKILANLLTLSAENFNKSILQHDFLEILVNVFPMPGAGYSFHEILRACFIGHVIQTLNILTTKIEEKCLLNNDMISILDIPFSEMIAPDDARAVLHLFKALLDPGSLRRLSSAISSEILGYVLYSMLLKSVTPFLRQATIFAFVNCHFDSGPNEEIESSIFEADKLCATLKLPTLSELDGVIDAGGWETL
ncbi:hypothetical protein CA3LBN_003158 [Candidozyma haemuli]|uniref:E3 ubiquitin-protein ligase n=1 Tax=Candidozyma haemuli TaxID=45357 RepID=A0ABX8IAD3_9ASCO|nr:hypothetical protein CA3LBN_003158 [[Candida] haemuloni]